MSENLMLISVNHRTLNIDKRVYRLLFDNSVVYSLAQYQHTLEESRVSFKTLIELARKADIPYTLFFGTYHMAETNLKRKNDILLGGVSKDTFSVNSRGHVELRDIELIIKDLIRKQMLLKKYDRTLADNALVGCLKNSKLDVKRQAAKLRQLIGLDLTYLAAHSKRKSFEYIVSLLESRQIFISQSARTYMPQNIQNNVKFSGICIRDKKVPFIFLNSKDDTASFEPEGRKILTLILLVVCLSKSRFKPLSYNDQSNELIQDMDYQIAEEILLPSEIVKRSVISDIDDLRMLANKYSVTPSAFLMRVRRLGVINDNDAIAYSNTLRQQFELRKKQNGGGHLPMLLGFKRYNGVAYSKAIIHLVDGGLVSRVEARKVLFLNKAKSSFLNDFRNVL